MMPMSRCLVIVPAYNEAQTITQVVAELREHAPDCDVLVVDDGSTDGTAGRVPSTAKLLRLPFNSGIGAAMQAGYRYAALHDYDAAVQVDGDGQHPPAHVPELLAKLDAGDADLVIGSRFLESGGYKASASRKIGMTYLRGLVGLLAHQHITDCTSGFRVCSRRVIAAFAHWYPDDYPEPEVVVLLCRSGFRVAESPVKMAPRRHGRTSIPFRMGVFYLLKVTAALLLDLIRHPWPTERSQSP